MLESGVSAHEKRERGLLAELAYLYDVLQRLPDMTNYQVRDAKLTPRG